MEAIRTAKKTNTEVTQEFSLDALRKSSAFARGYRASREKDTMSYAPVSCTLCTQRLWKGYGKKGYRVVHTPSGDEILMPRRSTTEPSGEELLQEDLTPPSRRIYVTPEALAEFVRDKTIAGVDGEFAADIIANRAECPTLMKQVGSRVVSACYYEFGMLVNWGAR
jgi:hypothetical protein